MGAAEVLARLSEFAAADMSEFLSTDPDGKKVVDLSKAERLGKPHLIEEVGWADCRPKIKRSSRLECLRTLARIRGMLVDRVEIEARPGESQVKAEILARLQAVAPQLSPADRAVLEGRALPTPARPPEG